MTEGTERTRILLVDDDEDTRFMIRDAIEEAKTRCDVYEVATGEEALEFLAGRGRFTGKPSPTLIYLDIDMPGMNGIETLRRIREQERFRSVPVVIMTNLDDDREKTLAAQYGANSYTLKPSDPDKFVETVQDATRYWVRIHQRPGEK